MSHSFKESTLGGVTEWVSVIMASSFAGSISAAFSNGVLQPFDVIRTKQQMAVSSEQSRFTTTIKRIAREEGVKGFWSGLGPTIWRVVPGSALYFFALDHISTFLQKQYAPDSKSLPVQLSLISAAVARGIASIAFLPITVVKTRFEAEGSYTKYNSTWDALKKIYSIEGRAGLFSGLVPTVLRDVPHSALYFATYNSAKGVIVPLRSPNSKVPLGIYHFAAGVISGITATVVSHPFDVIRTRLQTNKSAVSVGAISLTLSIIKNEGLKTFSRGFAPRLLRRSLSPAFTWTFYEELITYFRPTKPL